MDGEDFYYSSGSVRRDGKGAHPREDGRRHAEPPGERAPDGTNGPVSLWEDAGLERTDAEKDRPADREGSQQSPRPAGRQPRRACHPGANPPEVRRGSGGSGNRHLAKRTGHHLPRSALALDDGATALEEGGRPSDSPPPARRRFTP